uniref:Uncharacterized protein n=2 Tax=Anguilla anguilla TaxID=7936 RepID=A0A0E9SDJ7_ANGAN
MPRSSRASYHFHLNFIRSSGFTMFHVFHCFSYFFFGNRWASIRGVHTTQLA